MKKLSLIISALSVCFSLSAGSTPSDAPKDANGQPANKSQLAMNDNGSSMDEGMDMDSQNGNGSMQQDQDMQKDSMQKNGMMNNGMQQK